MRFFSFAKKFILILFAVSLCFTLGVSASAVTQADIDLAKEKREQAAERKKEQQEVVDKLTVEHDGALAVKRALEEKVTLTMQQIQYNGEVISDYDAMIEEKALEVAAARSLEQKQLKLYRSRVRAIEENGEFSFLDLLFQTDDIGALIAAMEDISDILSRDKELEEKYIEAREEHEEAQREYESVREDLAEKQQILKDEQEALEFDINNQQKQIDILQQEILGNQILLNQIDEEWAELNNEVNKLISEMNARNAYAPPGSVVGSGFIWPCGCTYITSRVGYRLHPVSGVYKNHDGMDVGAGYGDAVWAAAGGTVCLASYYGGYGNCVMINHNNGFYSLYGHLSSIAVAYGQSVNAGQTIGYVGSTGNSTGPHLHFEIRMGQMIVDPEAFFGVGAFSYAPDAGV